MDVGPVHHHDVGHVVSVPADQLSVMGVAWTLARPEVAPLSPLAPAGAWIVDLDAPGAPSGPRLAAGLRDDELDRASRLPAGSARRWMLSRFALRDVLGACLSREPLAVELVADRSGKPRVTGAPRVDVSLAHSHARAVVGVSLAGDVGVDVELVRPGLHEVAIARRVLDPRAARCVADAPREARTREFFAAWTRHEAALKCRGRRLVDALGYDVAAGLAVCDLDAGDGYAAAWACTEAAVTDTVLTARYEWPV
ncbi:MAG: 4'-phosphopantetheinyl transferase superfamily protein [Acidobacteriota bacterium]|nr:4'-phosphopantetheinyl transferase superfamily protein [Acidobacteriota bacterium]